MIDKISPSPLFQRGETKGVQHSNIGNKITYGHG
jgi:hypothetical protein